MEKRVSKPDSGNDLSENQTAYAESVAVEIPGGTRLYVSGMTSDTAEPDVETQTRDVLEKIRGSLSEAGGVMDDIVRVRIYVVEPHLTQENFEAIHAVRREFFEPAHYPASTLLEVSDVIRDERLIEIDADAIVPTKGWELVDDQASR